MSHHPWFDILSGGSNHSFVVGKKRRMRDSCLILLRVLMNADMFGFCFDNASNIVLQHSQFCMPHQCGFSGAPPKDTGRMVVINPVYCRMCSWLWTAQVITASALSSVCAGGWLNLQCTDWPTGLKPRPPRLYLGQVRPIKPATNDTLHTFPQVLLLMMNHTSVTFFIFPQCWLVHEVHSILCCHLLWFLTDSKLTTNTFFCKTRKMTGLRNVLMISHGTHS